MDYTNVQVETVHLGTLYSTGSPKVNVFRAPAEATLIDVDIVTGTAKTATTGTSFGLIRTWNKGSAGATGTQIGYVDFGVTGTELVEVNAGGGQSFVADIPQSLCPDITDAYRDLDTGDLVVVEVSETGATGAGDLDAEATVFVTWALGTGKYED